MANIRTRKRKKGTVYVAEIRIAGHRSETGTFDKKSEAYAWAERREEEIRKGIPAEGEPAPGDMLLDEAMKYVISTPGKSENTRRDYLTSRRQILKYFGEDVLLSGITTPDMAKYIRHRTEIDGVGASKIRAELTMIRMSYQKARELGSTFESPEQHLPRPKLRRKSVEDRLRKVVGEAVIIDRSQTQLADDKVFAIAYGEVTLLKRVRINLQKKVVELLSDNGDKERYPT